MECDTLGRKTANTKGTHEANQEYQDDTNSKPISLELTWK